MVGIMMEMTGDELADFLGPIALQEYNGAPEWDQVKIRKWVVKLQKMNDAEFIIEAASRIHDSALMERFRGNYEGFHARATACHREADRRHISAGHTPNCNGDTLYCAGWNKIALSQGYQPNEVTPCSCGRGEK